MFKGGVLKFFWFERRTWHLKYFIIPQTLTSWYTAKDGFLYPSPIGAEWFSSLFTWPNFRWHPCGVSVATRHDYYFFVPFQSWRTKMMKMFYGKQKLYVYASTWKCWEMVQSEKTLLARSSQLQHGTHLHHLTGNFRQTTLQTGLLERELVCLLQKDWGS